METFVATTLDELAVVALHVKQMLATTPATEATVVTLRGDLGAGKTAFVKALGQILGVSEHIVSPTFVVMKSYETTDDRFAHLVHMDAYRIEDEADVVPLRLDSVFAAPHTLFCIEWAELIPGVLPDKRTELSFVDSDGTRTITLTNHG